MVRPCYRLYSVRRSMSLIKKPRFKRGFLFAGQMLLATSLTMPALPPPAHRRLRRGLMLRLSSAQLAQRP